MSSDLVMPAKSLSDQQPMMTQCPAIRRAGTGHVPRLCILPLNVCISLIPTLVGEIARVYWGPTSAGAELKLKSDFNHSTFFSTRVTKGNKKMSPSFLCV